EGNVQRTPPTALAMITVEASIDAAERDSKWNAVHRPAGNEIKSRPDDANQMPVIFPAQIDLDLPAVVCYLQSSICNMKSPLVNAQDVCVAGRLTQSPDARFQRDLCFRAHTIRRPCIVKPAATYAVGGVPGAMQSPRPPVATHSAFPPSSSLI